MTLIFGVEHEWLSPFLTPLEDDEIIELYWQRNLAF
jgi:hypothetical protein